MTALLAATSVDAHGLLVLFLVAILAIVVIGGLYWLASQVLPPPWPTVIAGLLVLICVVWLLTVLIDSTA